MLAVLLASLVFAALVMLIMSVGVIFRRPCLRGSCGGPEILGPDGAPLTCATCPNRKRADEGAASEEASEAA
ncbi:MAG: hypothetical protein R2991_08085 [Thermoanaerobaculia bacterium]